METNKIKIQQIRSALLILEIKGKKYVIDPWLAPKGTQQGCPCPIPGRTELKIPLVDLPISVDKILENVEGIFITHIHPDHFEEYAEKYINKNQMMYTQNEEEKKDLLSKGFNKVNIVSENGTKIGDILVYRVIGLHGESPDRTFPGESSGYIFECQGMKKLYICGDTIYFDGVKSAIDKYKPDIIVVNACGATAPIGRLIMNENDVLQVCNQAPNSTVIISHMDTVNHYTVTREDMKKFISENKLEGHVWMPNDGESREF